MHLNLKVPQLFNSILLQLLHDPLAQWAWQR